MITHSCPHCGSDVLVRDGPASNGEQKYRCQACGRCSPENPTPIAGLLAFLVGYSLWTLRSWAFATPDSARSKPSMIRWAGLIARRLIRRFGIEFAALPRRLLQRVFGFDRWHVSPPCERPYV